MTNPTPRDSAQLPPLPDTVAAFRDKGTFTMPEQFYPADVIDAREALQASRQPQTQQAVAEGAGDVTDADIRRVFLANGFTVKEGQADLKPYVFQAARALLALATTKEQRS